MLPRKCDTIFCRAQLLLKLKHILACSKPGNRFCRGEQEAQRLCKFGFCHRARGDATCRHDGLPTEFDHGCERSAFVRDISLDAFDQIGNEIAAAAELNIDLCPGIARPAPEGDEPIVEPGDVEEQRASSENRGRHRGNRAPIDCQ